MIDPKTNAQALKNIMKKAEEKMTIAGRDFQDGHYDDAAARAYYAAFHAVTAVLACKGLSYSTHGQTIGAFNREFVATGLFPKELFRILQRLFDHRLIGDYDYETSVSKEAAEQDVQEARMILNECRQYLEKNRP